MRSLFGLTRVKHASSVPALAVAFCVLQASSGALASPVSEETPDGRDLYLEVIINGDATGVLSPVHEDASGELSMLPDYLKQAGIIPAASTRPDGRIALSSLAGVVVVQNEAQQTLSFETTDAHRVPRHISGRKFRPSDDAPEVEAQSGTGALLNYRVNANGYYDRKRSKSDFGLSGTFEGRVYGDLGTLDNSFTVTQGEARRLDSTWSLSDQRSLYTIRAGDVITGGLPWTRPARLGGLQFERNFSLRPDLITMPVPGFSSSAAVPSTVDVFLDNARRFTSDVPAGPFEITDMPVVTGPGTARVIVRDADGNETVTTKQYFVSNRLLRSNLLDYSLEAGSPRLGYGSYRDRYEPRFMATGTVRYGATDWLTLEGHAEGGDGLINGGVGFVTGLGPWGVGSFSAAASQAGDETGYQVSGSLEVQVGEARIQGRIQRAFGDFNDIASITSRDNHRHEDLFYSTSMPRELDQISLSFPVLEKSFLNLGYTRIKREDDFNQQLANVSFTRSAFGGTFSLSGYGDLERKQYGLFASLTLPLGKDMSASTSTSVEDGHLSQLASVSKAARRENGNLGWNAYYEKGNRYRAGASATLDTQVAKLGAAVRTNDTYTSGQATISGSLVAADDSLFLAKRIDDAFAVVDVGAPGVPVLWENRPQGKTGSNGKYLVTGLRSYNRNRISIDPANLPLDAVVDGTKLEVVPADRVGVVVPFRRRSDGGSALVSFRDETGAVIEVGATGKTAAGEFVVGYDGQAFIDGLEKHNRLVIERSDGTTCTAEFSFTPEPGAQVNLPGVACRTQ